MKATRIVCDTTGCTQSYEHPFGHGPADKALRDAAWMYEAGRWYCPMCAEATRQLKEEQKKKRKWS